MSETLREAGICPQCGAPTRPAASTPAPAPAAVDPALAFRSENVRYDLEALAAEAAREKTWDEGAKVRVTQQDIRKLLEKRRKEHK